MIAALCSSCSLRLAEDVNGIAWEVLVHGHDEDGASEKSTTVGQRYWGQCNRDVSS